MATWTISDELDARLRERLGGQDPAAYVEEFFADEIQYEDDPKYRAIVDEQIKASEADIAAGRVTDAREAMQDIADEFGINLKR